MLPHDLLTPAMPALVRDDLKSLEAKVSSGPSITSPCSLLQCLLEHRANTRHHSSHRHHTDSEVQVDFLSQNPASFYASACAIDLWPGSRMCDQS